MKRIVYCLLSIVYCLCACSPPNRSEESEERDIALKNNISRITEYRTILNLGGILLKEQVSREKLFDKNGFKIKEITHYDDGTIENIISLSYDKNGNLIFRKAVKPDSSVSFSDKRIYDENNNKTDYYFYNPDGSVLYRKPAIYDKEGRMIESRMYHDGEFKAVNKYKYVAKRMIENYECDEIGNFRHKWVYRYDERKNLIEEAQYKTDNDFSPLKNRYEYNAANLMVKETKYIGEEIQSWFIYEYNDKKLLSAKNEYVSGRFASKFRYQYE